MIKYTLTIDNCRYIEYNVLQQKHDYIFREDSEWKRINKQPLQAQIVKTATGKSRSTQIKKSPSARFEAPNTQPPPFVWKN